MSKKNANQTKTTEGTDAQDAADTVRMTHDDIESFSINGTQYDAVDGVFDLPHEVAAHAAQTWGFTAADGQGA